MCCISYKSPYCFHVFTNRKYLLATFISVMRNELLECCCLSSNIVTHHGLWKKTNMRSPLISEESLAHWISFVILNTFQTHLTRYFNWHKLLRKWFKLVCLKSILDIWIRVIFILKGLIRFALYHMTVFQWPLINSIHQGCYSKS